MEIFEDDDDIEIIQFLNYQRRLNTVHPRVNHMLEWDDHDFRVRFRLQKDVIQKLLEYIAGEMSSQTDG